MEAPATLRSVVGANAYIDQSIGTPHLTEEYLPQRRSGFTRVKVSCVLLFHDKRRLGSVRSPNKSSWICFTTLPLRYSVELEPPSKFAAMSQPFHREYLVRHVM